MEEILNSAMCDTKIAELIARKNEIVDATTEKRATFENADVETRDSLLKEVEELNKEADSIEEELKKLEERKATFKEQEERMSMVKTMEKTEERAKNVAKDVVNGAEYRKAYADYIKGVKGSEDDIKTILRSANLYTGLSNVPVPTIMQGYVETAWEKFGKFSKMVRETFESAIIKIPVESSADGANWHTENSGAPAQESITLGQITLQPKTIKKWISLTDELMAMAEDDFLRYVADELVYRVIKALDDAIINRTDADGLGVIGIAGNTNTETLSSDIGFNVVNEAIAKLIVFDNLVVAMNPVTFFNNIMGLKDSQNRPIYTIAQMNDGKPNYFVNGIRVEFTNALKAYDQCSTNDVYAVVGNFENGYRCNYPSGKSVSTLVDQYTNATEDLVRMIGKLYVAGNVCKLKHFAQIKKVSASV